ncbi:Endothelin-converting enzyme 1 [Hondaea fermentalgiana]|uniref:Endothelin-converting enzyme 1 n=1 Tax=Hondaea fermentalgiana TaxID=2315210 RepID=A0A2R5GWC6_9STRA|nr:Endothelin-converting enzyme 1 [Hondaea fermentalgiana]|eukprot:GBG34068.1 Endothelin-converting enzyme 1 [Hondaea fermentalgiana]
MATEDFYAWVNGAWLNDPEVKIPDDYPRWGSFLMLVEEGMHGQIEILESLSSKLDEDESKLNEEEIKLALIWKASMQRFEDWQAGKGDYAAVESELEALDATIGPSAASTPEAFVENFAKYIARCQELGIGGPIDFDKGANMEASDHEILDLGPSGLSLPSRAYYLDDNFSEQRAWYRAHLEKVRDMVGASHLEEDFVERVVRFETKLAQITMKRDQSRNYDQYYTITTLDDLPGQLNTLRHLEAKEANFAENKAENGDADVLTEAKVTVSEEEIARIRDFLEVAVSHLGLRKVMEDNYRKNYPDADAATVEEAQYRLTVYDGDYFRRVFKLIFREANHADIRAYMQYKAIRSASGYCTKEMDEEMFDFFSRKLRGQKAQKAPEKRTVNLVNSWVDMLMGKIFVEHFFSEKDKETLLDMIHDVVKVMEASVKRNDWLADATKGRALEKLKRFRSMIGYPDKWKDFSALVLTVEDSLYEMRQKVMAFEYQAEFLDKINGLKDKTKWEMPPSMVNAYFHPQQNVIVFPAAIIQPPFYSRTMSDVQFDLPERLQGSLSDAVKELVLRAANSGGIVAVIAHEISHGYDDQGRKFDHDGNMNDWWTPEDTEMFTEKTHIMTEQVEEYVFIEEDADGAGEPKEHKMSADLTMGENLADLGGLSLGLQAFNQHLDDQGVDDEGLRIALCDVFFRSWANIWKSKQSTQFAVQALATDPHAPPHFRGNLCKNIDMFHEIYGTKPGDGMYLPPEKRLVMW